MTDPADRPARRASDDPRAELITFLTRGRWSTFGVRRFRPEITRWLLDSGFAFMDEEGLLRPTRLGLEVGRALDPEA
jgi:hypothetical protein